MNEEVRHFSLRKLSVGLASVLVGVSIFGASQTVKADTVANNQASSLTNNAQSSDTQENENATKSTFSDNEQGNSVKSNATQNKDEAKNDQKQDQIKNVQQPPTNSKEVNDISDLDIEKNAVRTGSLPKADNQSNNQPEGNFQAQPQNSPKLAKKVLTTNLIATPPTTNGGFDEATWGKLDVTKWQGSVQDGVYELTDYTGDPNHIIVPNEADFEQAGKSTNGLQIGIDGYNADSLFSKQAQTIAFSKTNNQKVKAIGTNWAYEFAYHRILSKFDGSNLDVSGVTDMHGMFKDTKVSDLTSLAHWDTSNVTDMSEMFEDTKVSDLTPLTNWDTSKVTDMSGMFAYNRNISNLTPLKNWNTSNVTNMSHMFNGNKISDLTPLANWDTSKVTDMSGTFGVNPDLIDLKPIANWNMNSVSFGEFGGPFSGDTKLDLTNINNTKLMQGFLKTPKALKGSAFITNNADFVKAVVGQDLPTLTNTAKRTIVFNIPHATPETLVQIINYKALAPVQIGWRISIGGGGSSSGTGSSVVVGGHGSSSSGGFDYTLGGGGFSSGTGSSVVVGGRGSSSGSGGNRNIISHRMRMAFARVGEPFQTGSDSPKIIKTYSAKDLKASDWQLDDSKPNDAVIVNGQIRFKPVKIPHVNGYKAKIRKNPINPAMLMVSFIAVPSENKPLLPDKEKPSKPIEETPSKPSAPVDSTNKSADDLQKRVITELNSNDSGWTMPTENTQPETYTVEMPADNTIDLSDLVIAEPVYAQTRTQIRVTKRFKLRKHGKKHVVKHFKHRKKTVRQFKKYRL